MNDLLLRALCCEKTERPPVWIMRQAGRYLPEYQRFRNRYSLKELFFHPELATQITLLPLQRYDLDAAIVFSDILVVAKVFGLSLDYVDQVGPVVSPHLRSFDDVKKLQPRDVEESVGFVKTTIQNLQKELTVPLIGFCGGSFTVASYLIETGRSHQFPFTKKWLYRDPKSFHLLLQKITDVQIAYLQMQQRAGAKVLQIFESWAHVLSEELFMEFSLPYLKAMIESVEVPVILFVKGGSSWINSLLKSRPSALSFDWQRSMKSLCKELPSSIAIQGNFDPDLLYAPAPVIRKSVLQTVKSMRARNGWIVNLGHGIKPDISVESVQTLIDAVREASCSMLQL